MRKLRLTIAATLATALLLSTAAWAHSGFRQRIRYMRFSGEIWQGDDGGIATAANCETREQDKLDGGTWPLKNTFVTADGGMPNNVFNSCARLIESANGLDGGLQ